MNLEDSLLTDEDTEESLWDGRGRSTAAEEHRTDTTATAATKTAEEQQHEYEERLRRELESVRQVNAAIEGVIQSLGKAKDNMKVVNHTVNAASTLLNTWTRILSQAEHNQRLILDPTWHGATQDIADMEDEAAEAQRAAARREAAEQERKTALAQKAEEDERRKAELLAKQAKPSSRGTSRIGAASRGVRSHPSSSTSHSAIGRSTSSSSSGIKRGTNAAQRTTSGIGRWPGGRGRGAYGTLQSLWFPVSDFDRADGAPTENVSMADVQSRDDRVVRIAHDVKVAELSPRRDVHLAVRPGRDHRVAVGRLDCGLIHDDRP